MLTAQVGPSQFQVITQKISKCSTGLYLAVVRIAIYRKFDRNKFLRRVHVLDPARAADGRVDGLADQQRRHCTPIGGGRVEIGTRIKPAGN